LWDRLPENALLAMTGCLDPVALGGVMGEFLPPAARRDIRTGLDQFVGPAVGRDVGTEVLPFLGPEWGVWVTAPAATDPSWVPHLTAALRVRPDAKGNEVGPVLAGALNFFATLAVLTYNAQQPKDLLNLKTEFQGKVEVRYLVQDKLFPLGWRPAFAFKEGFLLLASSPEAVRRFAPGTPAAHDPGEVPLLRLSLGKLRQYFKDRHGALAAFVAEKNGLPRAEAAHQLDHLIGVLAFFDRADLVQHAAPDRASWVLRVRTVKPLR
jgi:hypothetical protein